MSDTSTSNTKYCSVCGKDLPLSDFNKNEYNKSGVCSICRHCMHRRRKTNEFTRHNLALENFPWPFNDDCHEMDIKTIHESIINKKHKVNESKVFKV